MFVMCNIKTTEEIKLEFLWNTESTVLIEKIVTENKIILHLNTGEFTFLLDSVEMRDDLYRGFLLVLESKKNVYSANYHFEII